MSDEQKELPGTPEVWVCLGTRLGKSNAPITYWHPAPLPETASQAERDALAYKGQSKYVVGGEYRVRVTRKPEGGISMHKIDGESPKYLGKFVDDARRAHWSALERIAETRLAQIRRERRHGSKEQDPLRAALIPLQQIAASLRTEADKQALTAVVIQALHDAWSGRTYTRTLES